MPLCKEAAAAVFPPDSRVIGLRDGLGTVVDIGVLRDCAVIYVKWDKPDPAMPTRRTAVIPWHLRPLDAG